MGGHGHDNNARTARVQLIDNGRKRHSSLSNTPNAASIYWPKQQHTRAHTINRLAGKPSAQCPAPQHWLVESPFDVPTTRPGPRETAKETLRQASEARCKRSWNKPRAVHVLQFQRALRRTCCTARPGRLPPQPARARCRDLQHISTARRRGASLGGAGWIELGEQTGRRGGAHCLSRCWRLARLAEAAAQRAALASAASVTPRRGLADRARSASHWSLA